MTDLDVRIVRLEPRRVVGFRAVSETPEQDAWEKARAWAEPKGLLDDLEKHPVFGFNNPDPAPDRQEYGYEFWIGVDPGFEPEGGVELKEFGGGLYASKACRLQEETSSEFFRQEGYLESWKTLHDWVEASDYQSGSQQWLESARDPGAPEEELVLDLYYPIEA